MGDDIYIHLLPFEFIHMFVIMINGISYMETKSE